MRVLIVDDYPDTVDAVGELLRRAGHDCRSATCGAEALAVADAFKPQIAILDIGLPDIDGYKLLSALRNRLVKSPAIPRRDNRVDRRAQAGARSRVR